MVLALNYELTPFFPAECCQGTFWSRGGESKLWGDFFSERIFYFLEVPACCCPRNMEQDSMISFPRFLFTWGLEPGLFCGWNEFFTMWKSCCPSHGVFLQLYNHASLGLGQREDCLGIVGNDWSYPCLPKLMPILFPKSSWLPHFAWWSSIYLRTRERRGKRVKNPFKELWHLFLSFREIKEKRHNSGAAAFLSWHTSKTLYRRGSFFSYKIQL